MHVARNTTKRDGERSVDVRQKLEIAFHRTLKFKMTESLYPFVRRTPLEERGWG